MQILISDVHTPSTHALRLLFLFRPHLLNHGMNYPGVCMSDAKFSTDLFDTPSD
jgi:hypothetical protein